MPTEKKAGTVEHLVDLFGKSTVQVVTEYRGMTVAEITKLRRQLLTSGTEYHVSKNTLTRLAISKLGYHEVDTILSGPTAIAFVSGDLVKGVKSLLDFQKDSKVFVVKAGILGGKVIEGERLTDLTKLPSKEELISKMLGSLNAPASNLVGVLSQTPRNVVNVLAATPRNLVNVLNQRKLQLEENS